MNSQKMILSIRLEWAAIFTDDNEDEWQLSLLNNVFSTQVQYGTLTEEKIE